MKEVKFCVTYAAVVPEDMDNNKIQIYLENSMFKKTVLNIDDHTYIANRSYDIPVEEVCSIDEMARFKNWVEEYFSETSGNLNKHIPRIEAYYDFVDNTSIGYWSVLKFTKKLSEHCLNSNGNIEFNPIEYKNKSGRMIRWHNGKSTEMIYINSNTSIKQ